MHNTLFPVLSYPINKFIVKDTNTSTCFGILLADIVVSSILTNPSGWISYELLENAEALEVV